MNETITWRRNDTIPLRRMASCLIVMEGIVYAGVWNGVSQTFLLYPEDFGKEHLSVVEYWTYYPRGPEAGMEVKHENQT